MAYKIFTVFKSTISRMKNQGTLVYTGGAKLRYIALPVNKNGDLAINGKNILFKGMFPNSDQFQVLDYSGAPLKVPIVGSGFPAISNFINPSPVMIPIKNPELFEGIQALIPVIDQAQLEDCVIELHVEPLL